MGEHGAQGCGFVGDNINNRVRQCALSQNNLRFVCSDYTDSAVYALSSASTHSAPRHADGRVHPWVFREWDQLVEQPRLDALRTARTFKRSCACLIIKVIGCL